jgi:hypothetical protein
MVKMKIGAHLVSLFKKAQIAEEQSPDVESLEACEKKGGNFAAKKTCIKR